MRSPFAPTLALACIASASGFATTSPDVGKLSTEALDALFLRAKPDMLKAAQGLDQKFQGLKMLAIARFGHLLPQEHRRKLQTSSISSLVASLGVPGGSDLNALAAGLRTQFCTDELKSTIKSTAQQGLAAASEQGLPNLPTLDPIIDAFWPCLCEDFTFTDSAWNAAYTASFDDSDAIVSAIEGLIPVIFSSSGGICTGSCRQGGVLLVDWLVTVADLTVTSTAEITTALPWLPSIASAFRGLGSSLAKCVCDGISWSGLVALFGSSNAAATNSAFTAIGQAVEGYIGGDSAGDVYLSAPFTSALAHLSTFPTFLLSDQAFCATGCQEVRQERRALPMRSRVSGTARHPCPPIPC